MKEKIITTFSKGKKDCEHNWIYSKKGKMEFTFPAKYTTARICENCGKHELVELDTVPKSTNNFEEIIKKFSQIK